MKTCFKGKGCGETKEDALFNRNKSRRDGLSTYCTECTNQLSYDRTRYNSKYRSTHAEQISDKDKRWKQNNRDKVEEQDRLRRAREKTNEWEPGIHRQSLRAKHGENCFVCEEKMEFVTGKRGEFLPKMATIEHVIPLSKGGGHTWENCRLSHLLCNLKKHATIKENP